MRASWLLVLLLVLPSAVGLAMAQAPERSIVQLRAEPTEAQRAVLLSHGALVLDVLPAAVCDCTAADVAWLRTQSWVARVEPEAALQPTLDLSTRLIRAGPPLLDLGFDGSGVGVAVLDSGIDVTHPDLEGRVVANVAYVDGQWVPTQVDTDGHGTHVAGIVAGNGQASGGALRGVAPGANLVGMDFGRAFTTTTALQAFDWVLRHKDQYNIRVVTNSWGRAESPNAWDPGDSLVQASNRLVREGIVVVFSAGNHGPGSSSISLEGQNPNVITVGAVDDAAVLAGFSGRGPVVDEVGQAMDWVKPDVVAAGVGILSARSAEGAGPLITPPTLVPSQLPGLTQAASAEAARYVELSGTSQAAPHVAGLAAVMLQANPSLSPAQVHDILRESAVDLGAPGPDDETGFGLVDAVDAVRLALGMDEDLGNILVAGGTETYEARGNLLGGAGQLVQTQPVAQVKPQGAAEAAFPVKVGATAATFRFAWTPATAAFRVYLVGPTTTLGPWTQTTTEGGERVILGRADAPEPGTYRLLARPIGAPSASYHATMSVAVREEAGLPADLDPRYKAPAPPTALDEVGQQIGSEVDRLGSEWKRAVPAPELALAAVACAAVALVAGRRRR
ncbi:MAG TPA: S8 family peptidase [Candidatus Thermoplasmatota archaeon]|jgi:serine protease AprX|nr:S8 family peptidase [Candidatus Thermoplasmatota archaeon]